jgi:hypothetical protein
VAQTLDEPSTWQEEAALRSAQSPLSLLSDWLLNTGTKQELVMNFNYRNSGSEYYISEVDGLLLLVQATRRS